MPEYDVTAAALRYDQSFSFCFTVLLTISFTKTGHLPILILLKGKFSMLLAVLLATLYVV